MPQIIALSCPVCGAPLNPGDEKCSYCGSYIFIRTDLPKLDRHTLNQSVIQEHITDFRRRVRSNQYDEEAHYGLGVAYFSLGLADEAVDELSQAAKLMPENPHIQAQLAVALRDSFNAGNQPAEQQMNTRIQSALHLDPNHTEAIMLKLEILLDQHQFEDAFQLYRATRPVDEPRAKLKLVSAFERLCQKRLEDEEWSAARWCWDTLEPIDQPASLRLAVRFLNIHASLVPKTIKVSPSSIKAKGPLTAESRRSKRGQMLRTLLAGLAGFVTGWIQFIVVILVVTNVIFIILSFIVLLVSASTGMYLYRRKIALKDLVDVRHSLKANRSELLLGKADIVLIQRSVDVVMGALNIPKKARAIRSEAMAARKK